MKYFLKLTIAAVLLTLVTSKVYSQDRFFARAYTSNVLPKGSIDVEFWHTSRMGHQNQYYNAQDQRMEIEFGLGGNLQTSVYYNKYQERFSESNDGTSVSSQIGFSNEWKWKLSDPSLNKIGLALYGEWGLKGGDELELETKIILDKYLNKKTLLAFNTVLEYEKEFDWVNGKITNSVATPLELNFGYQYFIKPNLRIGFELCNFNKITKNNGWENSVVYAGPTINFRNNRWFIIVNYLPQLGNLKKTEFAPSTMVLDEREKTEARIIVGISL